MERDQRDRGGASHVPARHAADRRHNNANQRDRGVAGRDDNPPRRDHSGDSLDSNVSQRSARLQQLHAEARMILDEIRLLQSDESAERDCTALDDHSMVTVDEAFFTPENSFNAGEGADDTIESNLPHWRLPNGFNNLQEREGDYYPMTAAGEIYEDHQRRRRSPSRHRYPQSPSRQRHHRSQSRHRRPQSSNRQHHHRSPSCHDRRVPRASTPFCAPTTT